MIENLLHQIGRDLNERFEENVYGSFIFSTAYRDTGNKYGG